MTNEELWQSVLAQIQLNISPAAFNMWFRNTKIINQELGQVIISVPNSFAKEWLEKKYNKFIFKILYDANREIKEIKYIINEHSGTRKQPEAKFFKKEKIVFPNQLDFQEFEIDKETNLNPKYSFDNFIVGSFNELAHAAATAVVKNPGAVYNPLFVYGGVGLGKTHLLQAIGNEFIKNSPEKKVKYLSSEKFTSEVVYSIKNQTIEKLKIKYRVIDVLIIDDIQFLAGKEKTQEEFFHIFNALYEKNKQIIISSDRPPKAIPTITQRLRSRFEGGMIADISAPDIETKIAILKTKNKEIELSDEIYYYIASSIQENIRELEGVLNKLLTYYKINKIPLDLEITKKLIKNLITAPGKIITPKKIIQIVCEFYDLKEKELLSTSRKKEIVKPRQIAMYLLRKEIKNSFSFIGQKFGGKDHTTIIYAVEKINQELLKNKNLEEEINLIKQKILII